MQRSDEKLCLKWNDFQGNVSSAFVDLRDDKNFTDVTLACEDGQQVEAHKVVLISSSPFFLNLLKRNKHPHPLVYMRGLKYENLLSMVDFLYHGEANVYQENFDSFLTMANELQLKGLKKEEDVEPELKLFSNKQMSQNKIIPGLKKEVVPSPITESAIALDNFSARSALDELDTKVKSMIMFSENIIEGQHNSRARICKVCGKEGQLINIKNHIEANHMTNISIPCNDCDKILNTRNALRKYKHKYHYQSELFSQ